MVTPGLDAMPSQAAAAPWPPPAQQGSLTEFDAPGASSTYSSTCTNAFLGVIGCGTTPLANNDLGEVVGTYTDAGLVQHAFLRAPNGYIKTIDAPGAGGGQGTVAFAIDDAGVIAGAFQDSNNVYHGFLRFPNGFFER
jgi:probable HAF family extracellular repeat protein